MAPRNALTLLGGAVLLGGVAYQLLSQDYVTGALGIGRSLQPLSDFPFTCRRITHPKLTGCEDLWLDDERRMLYAACTPVADRLQWMPAGEAYNKTGLAPTDVVSVLDIDEPGADGLFNLRQMRPIGYDGVDGDGALRLHGFDVEIVRGNTLRFFIVNHRVPSKVDPMEYGANSTIDVFEAERGSLDLKHVRTVHDPAIITPNKVAATGDGGFLATNDHSMKTGFRRQFDPILGGTTLAYCDAASTCKLFSTGDLPFPNGLVRTAEGTFVVPSSFKPRADVFRLHAHNASLDRVGSVGLGMPVDNFAVDARGDIYAAAFPKILSVLRKFHDPSGDLTPPSTVLRLRRESAGEYRTEKVLEDAEGGLLSLMTVARHDAKTGRLFLSGVRSPELLVCEPH